MEKQELIKALQDELKSFKDNMPTYLTEEDLQNKLSDIETKMNDLNVKDDLTELKEAVQKQGEHLAKMSKPEGSDKSLRELIAEKAEDLKNIAKSNRGSVSFTLKTDVLRASVTNHTLAYRLPDVGELPYETKLEPYFASGSVGANSNGIIRYVDQTTVTRAADWTAEGALKPESAITWQEYTLPIEKVADTIPVSMEAIEDVAFMETEIRNFLLNNIKIKVDNDLYAGDGVTPNIFGVYTKASAYTAVAEGLVAPNIYDLIVKMATQIATNTNYQPNVAFVSYADYSSMLLTKDTTGDYVMPPYASIAANGDIMVNGIKVVPSASVTADTCVVGDFNYATIYNLGGVKVDIGWINAQFAENMMTVRAERRLGMLIRNAHAGAFLKSTSVSADLTTLGTAPA